MMMMMMMMILFPFFPLLNLSFSKSKIYFTHNEIKEKLIKILANWAQSRKTDLILKKNIFAQPSQSAELSSQRKELEVLYVQLLPSLSSFIFIFISFFFVGLIFSFGRCQIP